MPAIRHQYGLLLPHFGSHASRRSLLDSAERIEAYGFDSVWVRDHLVYHPHEHEDPDRRHVDPFVVLSGFAARTQRVTLGTATLIPHRHPILTAVMLGSLDLLAGPGRVVAGIGTGTYDHEFEAVGLGEWDRREVIEEYVDVVRRLLTGESIDHDGRFFRFHDIDIHPVPKRDEPIPIWYGGGGMAAVRRAVAYCDGWIPSRIPRFRLARLHAELQRLAGEAGRPVPTTAAIPYVVPATEVDRPPDSMDVPALLAEVTKYHRPPEGRSYETLRDLDGAAIVGPPEHIVEEVTKMHDAGAELVVFDLRPRFADWEECLGILGEEVLPTLR